MGDQHRSLLSSATPLSGLTVFVQGYMVHFAIILTARECVLYNVVSGLYIVYNISVWW